MYQSIESAMLTEFTIDALVLFAALRTKYHIKAGRLIAAAAVGALSSGVLLIIAPPLQVRIACIPAVLAAMISICTGRLTLHGLPGAMASMLAVSALISAGLHFAGTGSVLTVSILSALTACIVMTSHNRWLDCWEKEISIVCGDKHARFTALIDTGNRLTEPVSGLPVLVVEEHLLSHLIPDSFDPSRAIQTLPAGFRLVAYGGVGGNGLLGCFMPDMLSADSSDRPAPDMWVAVYPGNLPGRHRALAPPSIIR